MEILPPGARPVLVGLLVLFGLYLLVEIYRWTAGNRSSLTPGQFRRRLVGAVLLELDLLLWYAADPVLQGRPAREKLLYMLFATLLVLFPMILAVREAGFIARQYARWRSELVRNMGRRDEP